ncbi:MAG: hypothetical protein ACUVV3_10655 [Dehalococcoidia bacterium]
MNEHGQRSWTSERAGGYTIDQGLCIKCDACRELAPEAVQVVDALAMAP